ncbi:hypothetical protein [Herpetosiphon giganteus]|uniref:hypothetical protein n=1 Tax=Herpetosiphon giganteus TaxID=2029754 RepID=UPI00195D22BD|nr:hypothetical protein [Herpetosiphon giganteus]MBM7844586.1 hypothetical protein [Herpetosiphon giganteus]
MTPEQEARFNQLLAEIIDPHASLATAIRELEQLMAMLQEQNTITAEQVRQANALIKIMQLSLSQQIPANQRLIQALVATQKSVVAATTLTSCA